MNAWLLVVYLFLPDGTAIVDRYEHAAASSIECRKLGWEKAQALYKEKGSGTYSFMCINTEYKP